MKMAPIQTFAANYAKLPQIAEEVYNAYRPDEKYLARIIVKEELSYYATALLHMRLIDVKAKQSLENLTSAEEDIRAAILDEEFNVPQPLYAYIREIGAYTDKMGKKTSLEIPALPVTVVQGFGGYHAAAITADTHNLFEEIPSLGIAGDMLMAVAQNADEPEPNFRIGIPEGSVITNNLVGKYRTIGPRRLEIRQRLSGFGITANTFHEYVTTTRFNLRYIRFLSDIIGKMETFRNEKARFRHLGRAGGESQVIMTKPLDTEDAESWTNRSVQPSSAATSSKAQMGASYCFGFQLYKENRAGNSLVVQASNWSCLEATEQTPWEMPAAWNENRNARRNLPAGMGTEKFRAISDRQDLRTDQFIRQMIKAIR